MGKLNPDDLHSLATLVRLASTGLDTLLPSELP